jgi:hypothetical protein
MSASWKAVAEGYGIQKVPIELARDLGCPMCGENFRTIHLYTVEPVTTSTPTLEAYRQMADNLVGKCYCKLHIHRYYGENNPLFEEQGK